MSNNLAFGLGADTSNQPPTSQAPVVTPLPVAPQTPLLTPVIPSQPTPVPVANISQKVETDLDFSDRFPKKNHTPLPAHLRNIDPPIQTATPQPPDNKSQYLLEQLVVIQRENQILLKNIMTSAALSAKIAKLKHRWQVAKFWTNILFWMGMLALSFWGAIIGYRFTMDILSNVMEPLNQVSQSASALQGLNGSMQNFDLESLLKPQSPDGTDTNKKYTSTTKPDSTFTTPAFINTIKNLNLSNMDSESLLKKLNITPYKSNPIETLE